MANSYTGVVNTNNEFKKVSEVTDYTFTAGNTYTMQIQGSAYLKIGDAEFHINNEKFTYKATSDDLYIKTYAFNVTLTILENE